MPKFSPAQMKKYMAGELRLITNRKTKVSQLVPASKHGNDRGITPPEKRAYYRAWYALNGAKRRKKKAALRREKRKQLRAASGQAPRARLEQPRYVPLVVQPTTSAVATPVTPRVKGWTERLAERFFGWSLNGK